MKKSTQFFPSILLGLSFVFGTGTVSAQPAQMMEAPAEMTPEMMNSFNSSQADMATGKVNLAIEKLKAVTKALPKFYPAHCNLGQAYALAGRNQEALEEFKKTDALHPNDELVLVNMGQLYQLVGQSSEALATYKRYLTAFPKGQYATRIALMAKTVQVEADRMKGVSSKGQDNYLNEAIAGGGGRWPMMPVKVYIKDGTGVDGYKPEYAEILKAAFAEWAVASGGKLQFQFVQDQKAAGVNCAWSSNPKDLINPVEGGQALALQDAGRRIIHAEILILTKLPGLEGVLNDRCLKHVCLHEIGHGLGLAGHSSDPGDIMFAAANFRTASGIMSERDKKTIAKLYAAVPGGASGAAAGNSNPVGNGLPAQGGSSPAANSAPSFGASPTGAGLGTSPAGATPEASSTESAPVASPAGSP